MNQEKGMKLDMKINIKYFLYIICLYLLVFQNFIQGYVPLVKYFDELLALFIFPVSILHLLKQKHNFNTKLTIKTKDLIILICLIIIAITGFYSNLKYQYQPLKIAISDMLLVFKFFMTYYLSSIIWQNNCLEKFDKKITFHLKIITIILFFFTIANYALKLYPNEFRYGIMSNKLFYSHATYLAAICIFLLANFVKHHKKVKSIYVIILFLLLLSTLRMKAIGAAIANLLIIIYLDRSNHKISITKLGIIGCICIFFAYNQISYYFIENDGFARKEILEKSFEIAKDYFPTGTGFGTYGSHFSAVSYSPIYYKYGLNTVYGLEPLRPTFIADSFWAMIIGQFGYIGLISYIICLIKILQKIQSDYSPTKKYMYISKIVCLIYLLISSTSESAFVNPMSIPLAIILGMS